MDKKILQFPKKFFWGAATAAHQIEGNNHNDWTEWEKLNADRLAKEAPAKWAPVVPDWNRIKPEATNPANYISGAASDHYNKFRDDISILKSLSLNAYRFSIEWSRVMPEDGKFDENEIEHYRQVIGELKKNNIEPFVTLWHRTNPVWVTKQGDWANKKTVNDYLKFVERMAKEFGADVKYWMPLNEPMLCAIAGFLGGEYPPQKKNPFLTLKAINNFASAQRGAYKIIKRYSPDAQVGTADAATFAKGYKNKFFNKLLAKLITYFGTWLYINKIKNAADFFGVQYYQTSFINLSLGGKYLLKIDQVVISDYKSDMGWGVYPPGLYEFLTLHQKRYGKPIFITENGISDALDEHREQYIKEHLMNLHRAIASGVDVRGYFYWSLLDNLEWNKGFWPKFGLVEVNRSTDFQRTIRQSALAYAKIAKNNSL